jgi:chaperonin GroES
MPNGFATLGIVTQKKILLNKEKKMKKIKPARDRILVKPTEADTVTASGIVIPDNAQEKSMQGKVIAVGAGRVTDTGITIPLAVNEGDTILYSKHAGRAVKIENTDYIVLEEDDVLAIVE